MKNHALKFLSLFFSLAILLVACEQNDDISITEPAPELRLETPTANTVVLNFGLPDNPALSVTWTDNLTSSSSYTIEMAATEAFEAPITAGTSSTNTFSMTTNQLNEVLNDLDVDSLTKAPLFVRINADGMMSNVIMFTVSAFPIDGPVVSNPNGGAAFVLSMLSENDVALTVDWGDNETDDTSYEVQLAALGTDFAEPVSLGTIDDDSDSFEISHSDLNEAALNLGLNADEAGDVELRIVAETTNSSGNMLVRVSEIVTISITPYSVELAPILYVVGAGAVDAGWGWDSPIELVLQGDTYSGNINLQNDAFRFFTEEGNWGSGLNFPYYEALGYTIDANFENANDGDSNFRFTGTPGSYSLRINTNARTITLDTPIEGPNCNFDQLWLVGAGITDAGWGWDTPVALSCTGNGKYSGNVAFNNEAFRFFSVRDDWGSGTNYPTYESNGYTIDSDLINANDGDSNFFFNGTPGVYFLTVDDINKTITLEPEMLTCDHEQLWLVGAGITDAGWGWDTPVALSCTGNGVYSGQVALNNEAFRFFTVEGDWGTGINYPTYEGNGYTIDSDLINANDGDSNFFFNGTPGTYTLTVDDVNKTITVE